MYIQKMLLLVLFIMMSLVIISGTSLYLTVGLTDTYEETIYLLIADNGAKSPHVFRMCMEL